MTPTIAPTTPPVELPIVDLLTGRGFITGKSGSGKSNTVGVIVEALLEAGQAVCIVDTDGEYYGLKSDYEILHVGAEDECDLQVGPEHAEKLAELALGENLPLILDVSGYLDRDVARALITETGRHLFTREKKAQRPFLLIVEEMHEFVPEGVGLDECGKMLVRIAKRGRKRGLGLCGVSQRAAAVQKDVITQADWLVWHRLTWDNDTAVARRVIGKGPAERIKTLDDGQALLQTDWLPQSLMQVQFDRKKTYDAGATPGLGQAERPDLKSVSGDIVEVLQSITEQQQDRRSELERVRADLENAEAEIQRLEEQLGRAQDVKAAARQIAEAVSSAPPDSSNANSSNANGAGEAPQLEVSDSQGGDAQGSASQANASQANPTLREEAERLRKERNRYRKAFFALKEQQRKALSTYHELGRALTASPDRQPFEDEPSGDAPDEEAFHEKGEAPVLDVPALDVRDPASVEDASSVGDTPSVEDLASREDLASVENGSIEAFSLSRRLQAAEDFLGEPVVREAIREAKRSEGASKRYVTGVIEKLVESDEPVSYSDLADHLGIESVSHVSVAVSALEEAGVAKKMQRGRRVRVALNTEGLPALKKKAAEKAHAEKITKNL